MLKDYIAHSCTRICIIGALVFVAPSEDITLSAVQPLGKISSTATVVRLTIIPATLTRTWTPPEANLS
jgi:hypothetical protein